MEVLAALGLGAKELFSYNRENFKFDQDQRIERETLRYEMQVKRFELFREDVRDLVELTVDRMDVYHLVGALFLEFCIVLFCEGRVQASAPPFLLSMFLLSNACAFIYLLLAVWLSMHASIASHSCGVKLLTRFVRLPIPSAKQMGMLRTELKDYERQSIANLLRLPFLDKREQAWETGHHVKDSGASGGSAPASSGAAAGSLPRLPSEAFPGGALSSSAAAGGSSGSSAVPPLAISGSAAPTGAAVAHRPPEAVAPAAGAGGQRARAPAGSPSVSSRNSPRGDSAAAAGASALDVERRRSYLSLPSGAAASAADLPVVSAARDGGGGPTTFGRSLSASPEPARDRRSAGGGGLGSGAASDASTPRGGAGAGADAAAAAGATGGAGGMAMGAIGLDANDEPSVLADDAETPFGGQDLLQARRGAMPERHVQLFRQLQAKWQCYDAYCRVCMGLGVNQILQGLSYYAICHTLVENHSPTTGYALVVLFQSTTVALAVLDLARMKRREILAVQVVGVMPCAITAIGIALGARDENGALDPDETYTLSPLSFLFQVLWLELWLRVAAPSEDHARLPRRFRQVLFLDVFTDSQWDPSKQEEDDEEELEDFELRGRPFSDPSVDDEERRSIDDDLKTLDMLAERAASQLTLAQCAVRRWSSAPDWALTEEQRQELDRLKEGLKSWGSTVNVELAGHSERRGVDMPATFEAPLRPWHDLTPEEKDADPFATCLVGPFEHDGGYQRTCYHYDLERQQTLFEDAVNRECPGALVLSLQATGTVVQDLERDARLLLESRIMSDLKQRKYQQAVQQAKAKKGKTAQLRRALTESTRGVGGKCEAASTPVAAAAAIFPNLVSLFTKPVRPRLRASSSERFHLLQDREEASEPLRQASRASSASVAASAGTAPSGGGLLQGDDGAEPPAEASPLPPRRETQARGRSAAAAAKDPTLVAMAGQHAKFFVPERLPWQVLSRMTRVLQLCWLFSAVMALLKETHVYQMDFQEHPAKGERRLLCSATAAKRPPWVFEEVNVEWPHGHLFRPQGLLCGVTATAGENATDADPHLQTWGADGGVSSRLLLSSPFALYASRPGASAAAASAEAPLSFAELQRAPLRAPAALLCAPGRTRCLLAAPVPGGIRVWRTDSASADASSGAQAPEAVTLSLEGAPWRAVAGTIVQCSHVAALLPPPALAATDGDVSGRRAEGAQGSWCLLLAGWDGELLPVAALPLPFGPEQPPAHGSRVSPAFDAPLHSTDVEVEIRALHVEGLRGGRLWALLGGARPELQVWELQGARSLIRRRLRWPAVAAGFRPVALCEDAVQGTLLVAGRSDAVGPLLLRADLPSLFLERDGAGAAASFLGLQ
eukprot:TRINITY_DN8220_c0_g2_i1.p1 TRINITY_DN8220_c0_g2~~TRINITY_DN8220_c0_g2_i1.p1  ORF type:complete len:1354 (+),score=308.55 TRINITY_DN8220_c0_g2_i1:110-4171(+)